MADESNATPAPSPVLQRWGRTRRARLAHAAAGGWSIGAATILVVGAIYVLHGRRLERLVELGLLQPLAAAFLAMAIVLGVWVANGSFIDQRRKGVSSASGSVIALRLWAICFALVFGAMLVSSYAASIRGRSTDANAERDRKGGKVAIDAAAAANDNATSIRVDR